MEDVGYNLCDPFSDKFVAEKIGAERIYGAYYSYSKVTGLDLIPSVKDPAQHDWAKEGIARPKTVFAEWLARYPHDLERYRPINEARLRSLCVA